MIDGEGVRLAATAATLDDLFRRAGVRHPHTLALADPPNRDAFVWGAPRKLSFAQADRAISACAAIGLQTDSIVAMWRASSPFWAFCARAWSPCRCRCSGEKPRSHRLLVGLGPKPS